MNYLPPLNFKKLSPRSDFEDLKIAWEQKKRLEELGKTHTTTYSDWCDIYEKLKKRVVINGGKQ